MAKNVRVGIIGASAERGWAQAAHVPAVQKLAGLELVAVASGSQAKADTAAHAFGAKAAYADGLELIRDPDVDLVTIAVKVPDHRELVLAAAAAGKHLFCEWPLGRNLPESEELAAATGAAGVHGAIGLQARTNPAVRRAREVIASGALGRVLSARVLSTTMAFGPKVEAAMAFAETLENGVTLATIQGAHTLDLALALLGAFRDLSALLTTQFPEVTIGDGPEQQARSIADHLLVQARVAGDVALSVEVAGGRPAEKTPFRLEIAGTEGQLELVGGAPRGFQSGRLHLELDGRAQPVDEGEVAGMPDEAVNVAGVYAALRDDLASGGTTAPDFEHAVRLTRMMDDVARSSRSGARQAASGWPLQ